MSYFVRRRSDGPAARCPSGYDVPASCRLPDRFQAAGTTVLTPRSSGAGRTGIWRQWAGRGGPGRASPSAAATETAPSPSSTRTGGRRISGTSAARWRPPASWASPASPSTPTAWDRTAVCWTPRDDLSHTVKLCALYDGLRASAALAEQAGVDLYLEPLKRHHGTIRATSCGIPGPRRSWCGWWAPPGCGCCSTSTTCQLSEGHLCDTIRQYADTFGHVHAADAPGRHEPGTREIAFPGCIRHWSRPATQALSAMSSFPPAPRRRRVAAIRASG